MAGQIRTFLEAIQTAVLAVVDGGAVKQFSRVDIMPFLDIERLMRIPRWPAAVIFDNGGTLDQYNGKIWTRLFSIAVIDCHPRDSIGQETVLQIHDRGEFLIDRLEYEEDLNIFTAGDDDLEAIGHDNGLFVLVKTYRFTAQFERS